MASPFARIWAIDRYGGIAIAALLLCVVLFGTPAAGQANTNAVDRAPEETVAEPTPQPTESPERKILQPIESLAPPEIKALFENSDRGTELAVIHLDGRSLFQVAAPAGQTAWTAIGRADEIEARLSTLAQSVADLDNLNTLQVTFQIDEESNQPVIYVNDQWLMTVTELDARLNGINSLTLRATQIAQIVKRALVQYHQERQPAFLWQQARWSAVTLVLTLLSSFGLNHVGHGFRRRRHRLRDEADAVVAPVMSPDAMTTMRTTLLTRRRINNLKTLEYLLQVGQVCLWCGSLLLICGFFPAGCNP